MFSAKNAARLTHFVTFLLLAGIAYMGGRGAINFGISQIEFTKYIPAYYAVCVFVITLVSSLMIISTEFIFSNNKKKSKIGAILLLVEALFLTYWGYQIVTYSERGFGPVCLSVGILSIALSIGFFLNAKNIKTSKENVFSLKEFLRLPKLGQSIKSVLLIGLALIFGAESSYFGTSAFGMFVGWSVGNTLVAYQYPLQYEISEGNLEKVNNLLDSGYSINEKWYLNGKCIGTPIEIAILKHRTDITRILSRF